MRETPREIRQRLMEPTNADRVERFRLLILEYHKLLAQQPDPHPDATGVADILADALHYCRANGVDYDHVFNSAMSNFKAEVAEEPNVNAMLAARRVKSFRRKPGTNHPTKA